MIAACDRQTDGSDDSYDALKHFVLSRVKTLVYCILIGSHTATHIAEVFGKMLDDWQLESKTHVVVRDNAANMAKGMDEANIPSLGCYAHTTQLCVQSPLTSKKEDVKYMVQLLAQCRSLVGHFSHSVLAKEKFRVVQDSMQGIPRHKLIQDVATRWNSTYYMVERLVEQEEVITSYDRRHHGQLPVSVPSAFKFNWLRQLVHLLAPIEEATRASCTDKATVADVIPLAMAVKLKLEADDGDDVKRIRDKILQQHGM